jgi:hypothetical protein
MVKEMSIKVIVHYGGMSIFEIGQVNTYMNWR